MTYAIYIFYTPSWQPLADIVLPRVKRYCAKHDYIIEIWCMEVGGVCGFDKMQVLSHCMDDDFIWVLDLDTLITNPAIPFHSFTDNEHDIFITNDVHGINAGSWIVRNTDASCKFIRTVIENFDAPEEQTVMKRYLDMVKVKYLPHPSINSYKYELYEGDEYKGITHEGGQWQPGDLLFHMPGLSLEKRIEILKEMI
jgi:hypothetical protein